MRTGCATASSRAACTCLRFLQAHFVTMRPWESMREVQELQACISRCVVCVDANAACHATRRACPWSADHARNRGCLNAMKPMLDMHEQLPKRWAPFKQTRTFALPPLMVTGAPPGCVAFDTTTGSTRQHCAERTRATRSKPLGAPASRTRHRRLRLQLFSTTMLDCGW